MVGKTARGGCKSVAPNDQWESLRVVFDLEDPTTGAPFAQPSVLTHLFEAIPDGGGPQTAVVSLSAITSIRDLAAPAPQVTELLTGDASPPIAHADTAILPLVDTIQRGGLPQWMVAFKDGARGGKKIYCDANSVLALPARVADVFLLTPVLIAGAGNVGPGLICEARANASVSWGLKNGQSAPMGPTFYSQVAGTAALGQPIFFERPPFAKRVLVIPPISFAAKIAFTCSPTVIIAQPPPSANVDQVSQPVPATATHVRVDVAVGAPANTLVHCIWEIGT